MIGVGTPIPTPAGSVLHRYSTGPSGPSKEGKNQHRSCEFSIAQGLAAPLESAAGRPDLGAIEFTAGDS